MSENVFAERAARAVGVGRRRGVGDLLLYVPLIIFAIIFVFPFFWSVSSSLKPPDEILSFPPTLLPSVPRWSNYVRVFERAPFARWILNTIIVAVLATLGALLSSTLVAYCFASFRYRGRDLLFMITLGTMMLGGGVCFFFVFFFLSKLGFVNTLLPLFVPQWF